MSKSRPSTFNFFWIGSNTFSKASRCILVDGKHEKIDLITGLNSGGFTEIIKGELEEGDQVISKVIVETSQKKALRLF